MRKILSVRRTFRLRPSEDKELAKEAKEHGYGLSTYIRIKLFNRTEGLFIRRHETPDMPLLQAIEIKLLDLALSLKAINDQLFAIQDRLGNGQKNLFGLDGTMRRLMQLDGEIHQATTAVNKALMVRTFGEELVKRIETLRAEPAVPAQNYTEGSDYD